MCIDTKTCNTRWKTKTCYFSCIVYYIVSVVYLFYLHIGLVQSLSSSQSTSSTSSTFQGETKTQNWQEEEKETDVGFCKDVQLF